MSESVAIICLGKGAKLAPAEFLRDLRSNWPDLPTITKPEKSGGNKRIIVFKVGSADVTISVVGTPVPWAQLKGPCENSLLWSDAAEQLKDHRGHLVVSVAGDLKSIAVVTLLTQVTASLAGTVSGVLGVYWTNANLVAPVEVFRHFAIEILPDGPPLPIWVNTRVGVTVDGDTCGYTTGMRCLGLMEIEAVSSSETPKVIRQQFHGLAYYMVENGLVIQDGHVLGLSDEDQIRITYSDSAFGRRERVLRLSGVSVKQRKKGWFL